MIRQLEFLAVCCALAVSLACGGCGGGIPAEKAYETNESTDETVTAKTYYLQTDDDAVLIPGLTLFDDGTFRLSYDVLNSYYAQGTCQLDNGRLTAVTDDGRYHYIFQAEGDGYVFLQEESSDASYITAGSGALIRDGSVFAPKESR